MLVNASQPRPVKADALAQANLDGGGNTAARRAQEQLAGDSVHAGGRGVGTGFATGPGVRSQAKLLLAANCRRLVECIDPKTQTGRAGEAGNPAQGGRLTDDALSRPARSANRQRVGGLPGATQAQIHRCAYARRRLCRIRGRLARRRIERVGTDNFPDEARSAKVVRYGVGDRGDPRRRDGGESGDRSLFGFSRVRRAAKRVVQLASPSNRFPPRCANGTPTFCTSPAIGYLPAAICWSPISQQTLRPRDRSLCRGRQSGGPQQVTHNPWRVRAADRPGYRLRAPVGSAGRVSVQTVGDFRKEGGKGVNVTVPFKLEAFAWQAFDAARAQLARSRQLLEVRRQA